MEVGFLTGVHLVTVLGAAGVGGWVLFAPKGSAGHRALGRVYVVLMGVTAVVALGIPAEVGPRVGGHFGGLHVLSVAVLGGLWRAVGAARQGRRRAHAAVMVGVYVGGVLVPGGFAVAVPGRLLYGWVLG